MADQILNGRTYKGIPDTFLYDLKQELFGGVPVQEPLPSAYEREFPLTFSLTKPIRVTHITKDADGVVVQVAYPQPDGDVRIMDARVPQADYDRIQALTLTGEALHNEYHMAVAPAVLAQFYADWGVVV